MRKSISKKIAYSISIGLIVSFSIIMFISSTLSSSTQKEMIMTQLEALTQEAGLTITTFIGERCTELKVISQGDVFETTNYKDMEDYLEELKIESQYISDLYLINKQGECLVSTGDTSGIYFSNEKLNEFFNYKQGDVSIENIKIDGADHIFIVTPVTDDANINVLYILVSKVDMEYIFDIVKRLDHRTIGEKGAFLINESDQVVFTLDKNTNFYEVFPDIANVEGVKESFDTLENGYISYKDSYGDKVLVAFSQVKIFSDNEEPWTIITVAEESAIYADVYRTNMYMIVAGFICFVITIIFILIISKKISRPIKDTSEMLKDISQGEGDLTKRIKTTSQDEVGELTKWFNYFITNIQSLVKNIKHTSDSLYGVSNDSAKLSQELNQSALQIRDTINQVAASASKQAEDAEDILMLSENLDSKIKEVRNSIIELTKISEHINKLSDEGNSIINELNERTIETSTKYSKINEVTLDINSFAKESETIITSIKSISNQTNLLALNASIEAARAGEAGKGFAVVANEIINLSEETEKATNTIRGIINNIQLKSNNAVEIMKEVNQILENQIESIKATGQIFNSIFSSLNNLMPKINEVVESSAEMETSKNDILTSIASISSIIEETSASTEEVAASTEQQTEFILRLTKSVNDLKDFADKLSEAVGKFKI
ncbi:methyl-accepting chemotaxis protein [Defluviitalea phaphyphila]|uniref:methyl-accepting chemotaxis protein n=1 Tax=Defluviitalea phaphyphila TaxID=1473580 RepID=UPI0007301A5D|nr:methyl-accepting chemotaxis protein [Defluviitalea phaphyphila]